MPSSEDPGNVLSGSSELTKGYLLPSDLVKENDLCVRRVIDKTL